jgi:cell division transport system permease protein
MQISLKEQLRSFRRSWVHHTGTQLATLSVLVATFTVVGFVFSVSLNLKRLLAHWGDSVHLSVYLTDEITGDQLSILKSRLEADPHLKQITYVSKEQATATFREQMSSHAPDLLQDTEFANPFPASFKVGIKDTVDAGALAGTLDQLAGALSALPGVEDVAYGQGWIRNYSSFVNTLSASGWGSVTILLAGSLFIIGNSVRTAIAARREEVEILELVGATSAMIRVPFVFEGALMGLIASVVSLTVNFAIFFWEMKLLQSTIAFSRLVPNFAFFGLPIMFLLIGVGAGVGALGAYLAVRQINDGWAASHQSLEA